MSPSGSNLLRKVLRPATLLLVTVASTVALLVIAVTGSSGQESDPEPNPQPNPQPNPTVISLRPEDGPDFLEQAQEHIPFPVLLPVTMPAGVELTRISTYKNMYGKQFLELTFGHLATGNFVKILETQFPIVPGDEGAIEPFEIGGVDGLLQRGGNDGHPEMLSAYWRVGDLHLIADGFLSENLSENSYLDMIGSIQLAEPATVVPGVATPDAPSPAPGSPH